MRALPWFLGGSAVAAAIGYRTWIRHREASDTRQHDGAEPKVGAEAQDADAARTHPPIESLPGRWVWPVGIWQGRKPEISSGYGTPRHTQTGEFISHGGVDIMYRRRPEDPWHAGTTNGATHFVMPDHRAALAVSDGVVWSAMNQPRGWTVVIDHSPRHFATFYTHLSSLLVAPKQRVNAGTPIGVIGADPLDGAHLKHLHFELWAGGPRDRFDPEPAMRHWEYLPDPGDGTSTPRGRWRDHDEPPRSPQRRGPHR